MDDSKSRFQFFIPLMENLGAATQENAKEQGYIKLSKIIEVHY